MQSTIVGVDDVVGDQDDETGNKGKADEDVEGGETGGDQEGSRWTPRLS
jgi:hypothetical protein